MIDFADMNTAIRTHFGTWWAAAPTVAGLASLPTARPEGGTENLGAGEFSVEVVPIWDEGDDEGSDSAPRFRCTGIVQVNIFGPRDGLGVIERLGTRVREWSRAAKGQIPCLRIYTTGPPRPLSAPAGSVGKHCDTQVLWLEDG